MSDTFANPQPPSNYKHPAGSRDDSGPMTNDDFRKLLMTPSVGLHAGSSSLSSGPGASVRSQRLNFSVRSSNVKDVHQKKKMDEKRKERKQFYAALVNESKEKQAELAQKYRDRAKERREKEKTGAPEDDIVSTTSTNYRAVAPGFSLNDQAERRRQLIEESKYLGGDIEHTHLVKGLDYALLQKVKAQEAYGIDEGGAGGQEEGEEKGPTRRKEATQGDDEDEDEDENEAGMNEARTSGVAEKDSSVDPVLESAEQRIKMNLKPKIVPKTTAAALAAALNRSVTDNPFAFKKYLESKAAKSQTAVTSSSSAANKSQLEDDEEENSSGGEGDSENRRKVVFKTPLGRNIYRQLFERQLPKTNELFQPNRMAYIVELNDDETDVPITSIRSKAECPNMETGSILTTNDIVINKLTQILSYLRHGKRDAKKLKKKGLTSGKLEETDLSTSKKPVVDAAHSSLGIYDDIGDYVPDLSKMATRKDDENKEKRRIKFDEKELKDEPSIQAPSKEAAKDFIMNINQKYGDKELAGEKPTSSKKEEAGTKPGFTVKFSSDSYAECYPGTNAEEDVNVDSDEEADFSKMDLGNKKGPVNRWDFDTNEEYSDYMSNREALPKAAFQYGLKMTDGRKTKRVVPGDTKGDKAKLDKEWTQISRIIDKRKNGEYSNSEMKKLKY